MSLRTLLNEPTVPMRLDYPAEARPGSSLRDPPGVGEQQQQQQQQHRPSRPPATHHDSLAAWQPAEARLSPRSDPSLSASLAHSAESLSVAQVLHTTSLLKVERVVDRMRIALAAIPNSQNLGRESARAITNAFNAAEPPEARAALWQTWQRYTAVAERLAMPLYPVQPDQVALAVSVYTPLPIRSVLRDFAGVRDTIPLSGVREMMSGLNLAARATRHLWPDIVCFIRAPDHYESTKAVLHFIENYAAGRSFSSRQPAPSDFYSAAVARQARPPLPPSRETSSRPLLTQVPPAAPAPQFMTPPPDQFIQPTRKPPKSLREICNDLPSLLRELADQPHDPADFDSAQERFSTVNTPQFAGRAEQLFKTAVEYTKVSALLEFPTYPITSLKLAVFALTMTPGPLGRALDSAAPQVPKDRPLPRQISTEFEATMKDVTTVFQITRGEDQEPQKAEMAQWKRWWEELTADWNQATKKREQSQPSQPAQPARKRARLSPSPAASEASVASTSKAAPAKTKPAAARSRVSVTEPPSRSASPSLGPNRASSVKPAKGKGKAGKSRPPTPPPVVYPVFVPKQKGVLPTDRREPPLPPIMDSPCYVPKKKKEKSKVETGDENGDDDGPSEYESSEDEETAKNRVGRSVALHRPRRGANDMIAFDVSTLWT